MPWIIIAITASYILGSIPTAYLAGRLLKGIDIRQHGSGNVGATNALRVLGKPAGIAVLCIDILKGFIAVFFLGNLFVSRISLFSSEILRIILGFSCIAGHNWTVFLKFKGGKGVAATLGVLLGLAVKIPGLMAVLGLVILTWLAVFIMLRIVSIASVAAGAALPVYTVLLKQSGVLIALGIILGIFIILRHRPNLQRFLAGKEPRLKFKK